MKIAFARCATLPEPDPDERLLLHVTRDNGLDADLMCWDNPKHSPSDYDAVILRATWNYYVNPVEFRSWLREAAAQTLLLNPLESLEWNLHKNYLVSLENASIPIIPTIFCAHNSTQDLPQLIEHKQWGSFVVKPAVSAASYRTKQFNTSQVQQAQSFLDSLLVVRDAMVQQYMTSVDTVGERNIIVIDNSISHTIRKNPRFTGDDEHVSEARPPTIEEHEFANKVLDALPGHVDRESLLYARIDIMQDATGELCLSELELIEPSLFLLQHPPALQQLVQGIINKVEVAV
jgi:hypothetical protein